MYSIRQSIFDHLHSCRKKIWVTSKEKILKEIIKNYGNVFLIIKFFPMIVTYRICSISRFSLRSFLMNFFVILSPCHKARDLWAHQISSLSTKSFNLASTSLISDITPSCWYCLLRSSNFFWAIFIWLGTSPK